MMAEDRERPPTVPTDGGGQPRLPSTIAVPRAATSRIGRRPRDVAPASISTHNLPPDALLKQMSPVEKDQLLRQLLAHRARAPTNAEAEAPTPRERDMLDVQEAIRRSYKEGEAARSRREQLDAEALRFGLRASTREFGEVCWRRTQEWIMDRRLLEEIQSKSLAAGTGASGTGATGALEARLVEEAKRESLRTARASYRSTVEEEARLLEEVKRESLRPPPATEGERLLEDARPSSLFECSVGGSGRFVEHASTAAAAAQPTAGDGATDLVQNSDDDYSSFVAFLDDRKPAAKKLTPDNSRKSGSS